jgi:hypothetical protein
MSESGIERVQGHLYRLRSRNLHLGVYDGDGGFIGIREKFGDRYLFTEYDCRCGPPYGTATPVEDLGPAPEGLEISSRDNPALFKFLDDK